MKSCLKLLAAFVIVWGMSLQAQAAVISLTPGMSTCGVPNCLALSGNDSSNADIEGAAAAYFMSQYGYPLDLLYKENRSDLSESGPFAGSYNTSFNEGPPPALANATIRYVSGPVIEASPVYALIKDGSPSVDIPTTWYLFNITGWNGTDDIQFSGFYAGNPGRISHVEILGQTVPDGGSLAMLLGMALFGLAGARRMMK